MSNYNYLYEQHKVEHEVIDGGEEHGTLHRFYSKDFKIDDFMFIENENNGTLEPYMYDVKWNEEIEEFEYSLITDMPILFEWVRSVKYVLKNVDINKQKITEGSLFLYQWVITIRLLLSMIKYDATVHDLEQSRQTGKNYEMELLNGFLAVFGKKHFNAPNNVFWVVVASYKLEDGVDKVFNNCYDYMEKNIELFNILYPDTPIFKGNFEWQGKKYSTIDKKSSQRTNIDMILNGEQVKYSLLLGLTTNTKNDGISIDVGWLDEGQATPFEEFDRGIDAGRTSTGANLVVSGISSTDTANVQYHYNQDANSNKIKLIYPVAYNLQKITHPDRAEKMKSYVESKFNGLGIEATINQTNYFLNWENLDGKFYSMSLMRKNNNFGMLMTSDPMASYTVAGLDLSTSWDYTVFSVMDVYEVLEAEFNNGESSTPKFKKKWKCELREILTYNKDKQKFSSEKMAEDVAKWCNTYKIDMIMIDGTSSQIAQNEQIYNKIKGLGLNTFVIPYNFGGADNKVKLMSNLEDMLYSSRLKLGSEEQIKEHWSFKKLIEEMLYMKREKTSKSKNIQWVAPEGKEFSDDHVMSVALSAYCVSYVELLQKLGKDVEFSIYKFPARLTKFIKEDIKTEVINSWYF